MSNKAIIKECDEGLVGHPIFIIDDLEGNCVLAASSRGSVLAGFVDN